MGSVILSEVEESVEGVASFEKVRIERSEALRMIQGYKFPKVHFDL